MKERRFRLCFLVLLAFCAQSIGAYPQQQPCFDRSAHAAAAMEMDCHSADKDRAHGQPDCCGDSCPDMAACAVSHAIGLSIFSQIMPDGSSRLSDAYAFSLITALSAPPFRPPALSNV
jgi:hypothetical protein